jgi:hypothetical protein
MGDSVPPFKPRRVLVYNVIREKCCPRLGCGRCLVGVGLPMRRRNLAYANATVRAGRERGNAGGGGLRGAEETLPKPDRSRWCDRVHARSRRFCGGTVSTSPPPPHARFLLAPGEGRRAATEPADAQLRPLCSCRWRAPGAGRPSTSM